MEVAGFIFINIMESVLEELLIGDHYQVSARLEIAHMISSPKCNKTHIRTSAALRSIKPKVILAASYLLIATLLVFFIIFTHNLPKNNLFRSSSHFLYILPVIQILVNRVLFYYFYVLDILTWNSLFARISGAFKLQDKQEI